MTILNKLLIVIYLCLTFTYGADTFEINDDFKSIIPQLIMLAFANISVVTAFFSKKWFGQLLLYSNFLFVGLIPLFFGVISCWISDKRIKAVFKLLCAGIPIVLMVLELSSYIEGHTSNSWEHNMRFVFYRLIQATYWFAVYMYASIHLQQELEKIERKD